jgi:hypothetical protein
MEKARGAFSMSEESRCFEAGMLYYSFRETNFPLFFKKFLKKACFPPLPNRVV